MSYVKDTDIFDATNGGLDIILSYYPNAEKATTSNKQFKLRESEKTASASLKKLQNGIWVVTDFGGDQVPRNGIMVCASEENFDYGKACAYLGSLYRIEGAPIEVFKPIIQKRELADGETPKTYDFKYKEFTEKELALLGSRVNASHCEEFQLKSIESYTYFKDNDLFQQAKSLFKDLNDKNISMLIRRLNKDWKNYLSSLKEFYNGNPKGLTGKPSYPKPKKLSKVLY